MSSITSTGVGGGLDARGLTAVPHQDSEDAPELVCAGDVDPGTYNVAVSYDAEDARHRVTRRAHLMIATGSMESPGGVIRQESLEADHTDRGSWHFTDPVEIPDGGGTVVLLAEHEATNDDSPRSMIGLIELHPVEE